MLWNTAMGFEKNKNWWPDPVFLHVVGRSNGAYLPSAQDYVGVPLRRNEISVFAPHDVPRLLLGITSEAFSFTVVLHYRKRTRRIFHATVEPVNKIRPHCWRCLKNQPTSGHSLPYYSKSHLRLTIKLGPVPSNFHFTENILPTRKDNSRCVPVIGNTDIFLRQETQTCGKWRDICLSWSDGDLSIISWLCGHLRLRSSPAESLEYSAQPKKRTVRSRNWHSNTLLLPDQSRYSLYCSKIKVRSVYILFGYRVNTRSFNCVIDKILELITEQRWKNIW